MTTDGTPRKRPTLAELGPAWITAIATLIAALVGALAAAGFFATQVSTPAPTPQTQTPIAESPTTATHATSKASHGASEPGSMLSQFNVDLPGGYGLTFGASPSRPVDVSTGTEPFLQFMSQQYNSDEQGTLAILDPGSPTYSRCVNSTRFTRYLSFPKAGTSFCYVGHNVVASITVTASLISKYDTLTITVWQAPAS
ncbi:hypothetical protein ABZU25_16575 [Micromonospora sp. NPDC005215]|uniref:hypothetical protein n=1 Tax=Micromonospora sp. NPDC005215 TaxID=3157024 RepID=UPI0033A47795